MIGNLWRTNRPLTATALVMLIAFVAFAAGRKPPWG